MEGVVEEPELATGMLGPKVEEDSAVDVAVEDQATVVVVVPATAVAEATVVEATEVEEEAALGGNLPL